jgi:hypothetical protein
MHSTQLGPAGGGTRMKVYESPTGGPRRRDPSLGGDESKCGGGASRTAVARLDSPCRRSHTAGNAGNSLLRYGETFASLRGGFVTAPDVNTDESDMDVVAERASGLVFCRTAPCLCPVRSRRRFGEGGGGLDLVGDRAGAALEAGRQAALHRRGRHLRGAPRGDVRKRHFHRAADPDDAPSCGSFRVWRRRVLLRGRAGRFRVPCRRFRSASVHVQALLCSSHSVAKRGDA